MTRVPRSGAGCGCLIALVTAALVYGGLVLAFVLWRMRPR
jgi:hypothetical protein